MTTRLKPGRITAGACIFLMAVLSVTPSLAQRGKNNPVPRPPRAQQHHSGQWLRQNRNLPPEQQRKALENDPQFRKLPPQKRQQLQQRLQHFNSRPPQEQEKILNRMETWEHLTPEQKQQARQVHSQLQQLPPERRTAVQNGIKALRAMPPEARQRQIDSDRYKSQFSPGERQIMGGASKLPLAPSEPNEQPAGPQKP